MDIKEALQSKILNEFITKDYLDLKLLFSIKDAFRKNKLKHVQLKQFFKEEKFASIEKEMEHLGFTKEYAPEKHSYSASSTPKEVSRLLNSEEFKTYVGFITTKKGLAMSTRTLRFAHKDYTLLDDEKQRAFLELLFFFDPFDEEFGGWHSYIQENEEVLRIVPEENTFTLVYLQNNTKRFIKYINVQSGNERYHCVNSSM